MYKVENTIIKSVGIIVKFSKLASPPLPTTVMRPSASALARVPASVDKSPQLNTPLDNRGDITFDSNDIFTPAKFIYTPHRNQRQFNIFHHLFASNKSMHLLIKNLDWTKNLIELLKAHYNHIQNIKS